MIPKNCTFTIDAVDQMDFTLIEQVDSPEEQVDHTEAFTAYLRQKDFFATGKAEENSFHLAQGLISEAFEEFFEWQKRERRKGGKLRIGSKTPHILGQAPGECVLQRKPDEDKEDDDDPSIVWLRVTKDMADTVAALDEGKAKVVPVTGEDEDHPHNYMREGA